MRQDLLGLAEGVFAQYPVTVDDIKVVQSEEKKAVWLVQTGLGPLALKRHGRPIERVRFSLAAQDHLNSQGARVPEVIRPNNGDWIAVEGGMAFSVSRWITASRIRLSDPRDLQLALEGLGHFHKHSRGFKPPEGAQVSTKLGRWPYHYETMRQRVADWTNLAPQWGSSIGSRFEEMSRDILEAAGEAVSLLTSSWYDRWVKDLESLANLCHQDYGEGNAVLGEGGIWVLDLDDVTLDIPVRDLRKITNKVMSKRRAWDDQLFETIMGSYQKENPLAEDELRVLLIDLLFPHVFHETAKNPFKKGKKLDWADLEEAFRYERSKYQALRPRLE